MNAERLLMLAAALEKDADNPKGMKFDLMTWGGTNVDALAAVSCGTTACAVGLACLLPEFNAQGLVNGGRRSVFPMLRDEAGTHYEWAAVRRFFDITPSKALHLFVDERYISVGLPTQGREGELAVAKRIREFVAAGEQDGA